MYFVNEQNLTFFIKQLSIHCRVAKNLHSYEHPLPPTPSGE